MTANLSIDPDVFLHEQLAQASPDLMRAECDDHNARGVACEWAEGADVARFVDSSRYVAAFHETTSGHLHPLKYALGLAQAARAAGVRIHEHSPVTRLDRGRTLVARTPRGQVTARYGVMAGNCMLPEYGPGVAPEIAPRVMPVGTGAAQGVLTQAKVAAFWGAGDTEVALMQGLGAGFVTAIGCFAGGYVCERFHPRTA